MLEEVQDAEIMANMTREAADQAMMRAMDGAQKARNASSRMDELIQVSRDVRTDCKLFRIKTVFKELASQVFTLPKSRSHKCASPKARFLVHFSADI